MRAFNERRLTGQRYPFLPIDAMVIKVRADDAVRPLLALICSGVNAAGYPDFTNSPCSNELTH